MSRDEANAISALKNAWLGMMTTAQELSNMAPSVQELPDDTSLASLDFETYHRLVGSHANAVMGVHGLLDELKRQAAPVA
ncbi:MAG: hypothetical protein ABIP90_00565 [Vicinamibacterales bacterium]